MDGWSCMTVEYNTWTLNTELLTEVQQLCSSSSCAFSFGKLWLCSWRVRRRDVVVLVELHSGATQWSSSYLLKGKPLRILRVHHTFSIYWLWYLRMLNIISIFSTSTLMKRFRDKSEVICISYSYNIHSCAISVHIHHCVIEISAWKYVE